LYIFSWQTEGREDERGKYTLQVRKSKGEEVGGKGKMNDLRQERKRRKIREKRAYEETWKELQRKDFLQDGRGKRIQLEITFTAMIRYRNIKDEKVFNREGREIRVPEERFFTVKKEEAKN
jgi:hypothetical protein